VLAEIGETPRDIVVSDPEITEKKGIGEGTGREEGRGREKRGNIRRKCGVARWKSK
jgi:hypothetical protein